ncbi:MAG: GDSL-type esterase/lipase family protein [Planctomycetia bacterium]|nr:GDSL-type esterase/lipase family protein [Planctomycetia bacterium]
MNKIILSTLACVVALACATSFAATIKSGDTIAWLGDSITFLGGFPNRPGYVNLCENAFKANGIEVKMHRFGVSGHKSTQMLDRVEQVINAEPKPTWMTLSCGVNDVWHGERGVALPQYKENITKIIDKVQAAGIQVVIFTATMIQEDVDNDLNKKLVAYNDFLREIAKEKGCVLADMNQAMQKQVADYRTRTGLTDNFLTGDGVHMNFLGDVMMARTVLKEGFAFTDAEMKKAEETIGKEIVRINTCPGSRPVYTGDACISGRLYLDIVENAVADKFMPSEYIRRRFAPILSETATEVFQKNIEKNGFDFTDAEEKAVADENKRVKEQNLPWRWYIDMSHGDEAAFIDKVGLDINLHYGVSKRAKEAGLTPEEFMSKNFGAVLNAEMEKLYKDACYLRTDGGTVPHPRLETVDLPIWDISENTERQTVVAKDTEGPHFQAATARADDGTIYAVWSWKNHGGPCGPMAMSKDGGKTWTRVDERLPEVYAKKFTNCPVIYRIVAPDGKARLFIMANLERKRSEYLGILMSEDNGLTWVERPSEKWACWNPPTALLPLKDGSTAIFGQRLQAHIKNDIDRPTDDQEIWMSITKDGGLTWSPQRTVAKAKFKNLCEPFAFRSDDGKEIGLLIRENRHTARSMMCFSRDEGKTWTEPIDTCRGLTGDRHQGVRAPDGRWVITYRDICNNSPTFGQYMAWVGTYDDIRNGRPGQFRIHLLHHRISEGWAMRDTGYSGVELLPDGTILCTTYTQHTPEGGRSIVATRFKLDECDPKRDLKPAQ